jgi:hypothetical protein
MSASIIECGVTSTVNFLSFLNPERAVCIRITGASTPILMYSILAKLIIGSGSDRLSVIKILELARSCQMTIIRTVAGI